MTQYVVYEPRTNNASLNLGENLATIGFVLTEKKTGKPVRENRRFIRTELVLEQTKDAGEREIIDIIDTEYAKPAENPEFFLPNS